MKGCKPTTKGIFKKTRPKGGQKKENSTHQYTEMNFAKWWWRMGREGQLGPRRMDNKNMSISGKAMEPGLHISVVERDGEGRVEGQPRESNEEEDKSESVGWRDNSN